MKKRHELPDDRLNPVILQQQLIYLRSELDRYRLKVRDYQENYHYSQLEKFKIENSHLFGERQQFINQIEKLNHINQTLQNKTMDKEALIEELRKQIENLQEENKAVNDKLEQAASNIRKSLNEVEEHKHSNQQLKNQLTSIKKELVLRSDKQTQSEEMIQKLQHSNQILSDKNKQLKEEKTQLKEGKLTLESFQIEMNDKIEDLKQEILLNSSGEMTGSPSQNTKIEYNKLLQQIEQLFSQINDYGEKISTCMSLTNHFEEHIDNLTKEIEHLKSTLSASSTRKQTL